MKPIAKNKLSLARETLRVLSDKDLNRAAGGKDTTLSPCKENPTVDCRRSLDDDCMRPTTDFVNSWMFSCP